MAIPCEPIPFKAIPFGPGSTIFAPMEGVTTAYYRSGIAQLYPNWDAYMSDFLRVPSNGNYPDKFVLKHWGMAEKPVSEQRKTALQFLISPTADTEEFAKQCQRLQIPWIDINLGCPSKTVTKRGGGSAWLKHPNELKNRLLSIRENYSGIFSAKIRIGWDSPDQFSEILQSIEDSHIDFITIHARTREQLYKGFADWDYIKQAVEQCKVPIIGNGDVWTPADRDRMLQMTGCHSVMVARGALKSPWFCEDGYREFETSIDSRLGYFDAVTMPQKNDHQQLKQIKNLSRYLWDSIDAQDSSNNEGPKVWGKTLKSKVLRSQSMEEFKKVVKSFTA